MSKPRFPLVLVAAAVGALLIPGTAPAPPRAAESVTLTVLRTYDNLIRTFKYRFSGAISSGQANEEVTVLMQTCGFSSSTAIAGGHTRSGGAWEAEPASSAAIGASATYRARWRSEESEPVLVRSEIRVTLERAGKRKVFANVHFWIVRQDLQGRAILLERFRNKAWSTVRRQKLKLGASGRAGYGTTFTVPRGWTVRARVPTQTAAPCFLPNASEKVRTR
jgi:hypothetical protein